MLRLFEGLGPTVLKVGMAAGVFVVVIWAVRRIWSWVNAEGIRHLMMHDPKTGKYERVTGSPDEMKEALASGPFYIYTKDPNVQALTDLMNRAIDKPSEHVQVAGADGGPS